VWIDVEASAVVRQDLPRHLDAALRQEQRAGPRRTAEAMAESNLHRAKLLQTVETTLRAAVAPSRCESTTIWRPELDVEIDASVFEFEPPG
jgi:hypothetical protein